MRAIHILLFFTIIVLCGCSTIKVAKEVTKVTNSIKASIENIDSAQEEKIATDTIKKENKGFCQPDRNIPQAGQMEPGPSNMQGPQDTHLGQRPTMQ